MKKAALLFLFIAILAGCASTNLPPVTAGNYAPEQDEKRLWTRSEEEEKTIDKSGLLFKDEALENYLNEVARKIEPPGAKKYIKIRVKVLKNPYLNAFAYPNGIIYVHTGILSRMENEAQLATLLAHEMTHSTHRHGIKGFRSAKNKSATLASLRVSFGGLPVLGDLVSYMGEVGAMAAVTGYSRDLETEADTEGLKLVVNAGYDPRESPKLFAQLIEELKEENIKEPFFFGTHPKLQDRVDNYKDLLKDQYRNHTGKTNQDIFLQKVQKAMIENALLDLKAGRFTVAQRDAEKYLVLKPNNAKALFIMGEIYRQRDEGNDTEKAKGYYQKSLASDSSFPEAYKGLGLIYYKSGNKGLARKNLASYLSLAPNAPDREYIQGYLKQLP